MEIVENVKAHPYLSATVVFVVGAAVVVFLRSGSSAPTTGTDLYLPDNSSAVAAGTAIQAQQNQLAAQSYAQDTAYRAQQDTNATNLGIAQLAATIQMNGQNVQADTINKQTAGTVQVAKYQYDSTNFGNQLVAETQQQRDVLSAQTTQQANVLQAQTLQQSSALAAQVRQSELATSIHQSTLMANAYAHAADVNASVQTTLGRQNQELQSLLIEQNAWVQVNQAAAQVQIAQTNAQYIGGAQAVAMQYAQNQAPRSLLQSIFG